MLWGHDGVNGLILRVARLEGEAHDFRKHCEAPHAVIVSSDVVRAIEGHLADEARHAERRTWLRRMLGDRLTGLVFDLLKGAVLLYIAIQVGGR